MNRLAEQEADAVAALPDLSAPAKEAARATGTDNAQAASGYPRTGDHTQARPVRPRPGNITGKAGAKGDPDLSFYLAREGSFARTSPRDAAREAKAQSEAEDPCKQGANRVSMGRSEASAGVAELADAQDSKSCLVHTKCGFDSHLRQCSTLCLPATDSKGKSIRGT